MSRSRRRLRGNTYKGVKSKNRLRRTPSTELQRIFLKKPRTLKITTLKRVSPPKRYKKLYNKPSSFSLAHTLRGGIDSKLHCRERIRRADRARRSAFFKYKSKGGYSRPAHNQKHKRIC
jgi:hypothetical protein